MIILDTNVVSEPMRPQANAAVLDWLDRQVAETLYLTATSLAELLVGIGLLPQGRRREQLKSSLAELLGVLFRGRILAFDAEAATRYADIVARARGNGQMISVADAQIAAIAATHGFHVATRDTGPFVAAGVPVIDPWEAGR